MTAIKGYTSEDVMKLLRKRFNASNGSSEGYIVMEQVADGTGWHQGRWIDAVVFSMWPSKGLTRSAFEVKVSRADFIRELQNPLKHKWCFECFDDFWFVGPKEAITMEELPVGAGWMCPQGSRLVIKRHAVKNPNPKLDNILLAAFMRGAKNEIDRVTRTVENDLLENSTAYKKARLYQDAITLFVNQRGNRDYLNPETPEDVVNWINNATMDKQLQQDRDQLLMATGQFQRNIVALLDAFLVIANKALLERDKFGQHIVSAYGGTDRDGLNWLKAHAKERGAYSGHKLYAELLETLLNLDKPTGK